VVDVSERPGSAAPRRRRRLVVALGGNAIQRAHDRGTWGEAVRQMRRASRSLAAAATRGLDLVVTHGNGPQVGALLREAELGAAEVPAPPLHVLGAETEGQIGYLIAQELGAALDRVRAGRIVVPVVSRTQVARDDPAFRRPTKPVGRFYSAREAVRLQRANGWTMREDPERGGWRRIVPSPRPRRWLEGEAVRAILDAGLGDRVVFVVAGGGGVPVVRRGAHWEGVDAVIDKDLGAGLVAKTLGADTLVIVTDVPGAAVGFGRPGARWLGAVDRTELARYHRRGEFAAGSMGPKVEAGLGFLRGGGQRFAIADFPSLPEALSGRAGTRVWGPLSIARRGRSRIR
jgi:carbamate kinase